MREAVIILLLILFSFNLNAQTSYTGYIDKYPIELVTDIYSDGVARAVYAYTKYDEPIVVNGEIKKEKLTLYEQDKSGKNKAVLTFDKFAPGNEKLEGIWKDLVSGKELKISLKKNFDIGYGENLEWSSREILQPITLKDKYFKLVISKEKGEFYASVSGIKIFEKKTDKLIQQIEVACQLRGLDNISVEDYNFDGMQDFSVFESSYAGPNTSSIYFLYNPQTNQYFDSGFSGTSLEFDSSAKVIYEHNQCCAGNGHMNATYRVVNNKMVLVKKSCLEYDEKKQDFVKVKCN